MTKLYLVPKVGDTIYVPTALHCGHGCDDRHGGKAVIKRVEGRISAGEQTPFVVVIAFPHTSFNWSYLAEQQEGLRAQFGDQEAHPDPDYRPEFNQA